MTFSLIPTTTTPKWRQLKLGGGGFCTGISTAPDGTMIVRTDGAGAYYYNRTAPNPGNAGGTGVWQQLVSSKTMPASPSGLDMSIFECVVAPSNSNRLYMMLDGYMFRSDNRGTNWIYLSNFAQDTSANGNGGNRGNGPFMAIDPVNPDVAFVATTGTGVSYTQNAGVSWTTIPTGSIPKSATFSTIAFDPSSSSGGNTPEVYVFVNGSGLYKTTSYSGGTWVIQNSTGMPTTVAKMLVSPGGIVFVVDGSVSGNGNLWKFASSTWTELVTYGAGGSAGPQTFPSMIALDPTNTNHLHIFGIGGNLSGGQLMYSANSGTTVVGPSNTTTTLTATDCPWMSSVLFLGGGHIVFDPLVSGKLIFSNGLGVWYTTPPQNDTSSVNWTSMTAGIENLDPTWGISPPGYSLACTFWDRGVFSNLDPGVYPSGNFPSDLFSAGWSVDYATGAPNELVVCSNWASTTEASGVSYDGGKTWTTFTSQAGVPGGGNPEGGMITAAGHNNYVMLRCNNSSNNNQPYYTTDGGTTWNPITLSGVPLAGPNSSNGWPDNGSFMPQVICSDKVDVGTSYLFNTLGGSTGSVGSLWKTTNSGVSYTNVNNTDLAVTPDTPRIRAVPYNSGHLLYSAGLGNTQNLMFSTNHGTNFSAVTNMITALGFGFGAPAPGQSYPSIYVYGTFNGVIGLYRTTTGLVSPTWVLLDANPGNILGTQPSNGNVPIWVEGDMNYYGTCYVGWQTVGVVQGYFP